jgi:XTP/dITP diphosphohydrolase
MQLIFATNNENKVKEIRNILGDQYHIITMKEAGFDQDIPEPFDTLEENARTKSQTLYTQTGLSCFSEDTGLFVPALGGAPGVKSARYAGDQAQSTDNIEKLLHEMQEKTERSAFFRTIISLIMNGIEYQFEGICEGRLTNAHCGRNGFGYDPVFIPNGAEKTFAEMDLAEKAAYSHRKKAVAKLVGFLQSNT